MHEQLVLLDEQQRRIEDLERALVDRENRIAFLYAGLTETENRLAEVDLALRESEANDGAEIQKGEGGHPSRTPAAGLRLVSFIVNEDGTVEPAEDARYLAQILETGEVTCRKYVPGSHIVNAVRTNDGRAKYVIVALADDTVEGFLVMLLSDSGIVPISPRDVYRTWIRLLLQSPLPEPAHVIIDLRCVATEYQGQHIGRDMTAMAEGFARDTFAAQGRGVVVYQEVASKALKKLVEDEGYQDTGLPRILFKTYFLEKAFPLDPQELS